MKTTTTTTRRMSTKQISKALAGLDLASIEMSTGEIELCVKSTTDASGCDRDATEALYDEVVKRLPGWGGHSTGYGGWVLKQCYVADTTDFNSVSGRDHY